MTINLDWINGKLSEIHDVANSDSGNNSHNEAMDGLATVRRLCRTALAAISEARQEPTARGGAEWVADEIETIRDLARDILTSSPESPASRVRVASIRQRAQDLMNALHDRDRPPVLAEQLTGLISKPGTVSIGQIRDEIVAFIDEISEGQFHGIEHLIRETLNARRSVTAQLTEAITPRINSVTFDPYPACNEDVSSEIVDFIEALPASNQAGIEELVRERLDARHAARAEARQRITIERIMRDVATEHLYPALRAAGIPDPENTWELRGRWEA